MTSIQQIQNALIEDVNSKFRYYVELKWDNNMGSIHIYTHKDKLFQTVLNLANGYNNYWKKEYIVESVIIKEVINRNPHIKINASK